ncbi:MAG: C12orf4 family protein [Alphaproteobacteria bacterium]|nr:C12orf4 family protein [Alphaproteobacteria bacterium]
MYILIIQGLLSLLCFNNFCLASEKNEELNYVYNQYEHGYPKTYQACIAQSLKEKNQAEIEHICAQESFEIKLKDLDSAFHNVAALYKKWIQTSNDQEIKKNWENRLQNLQTSQKRFAIFLKEYGKSYAFPFLRLYPYHFYGSMIDLINIRILHLEILLRELN